MKFPFLDDEILTLSLPTKFQMSGSSTLAAPSADLVQALMGFPASAGKPVTRATAIRVAAVLSSVKMLASDIAKMPLTLYQTSVTDGRQRRLPAIDNPLYPLLRFVPNRWQTSYQLRWFLASQLLMNGNCFCQIIKDQKGDVIELIPLNAWAMTVKWDETGGPKPQRNKDGSIVPVICWHYVDGHQKICKFYQGDLWHVTANNLEGIGIEGASMVALGKEAISVLIAAEEYAGRNFANGLGMGGFITSPAEVEVDEEQAQNVVDRLKKDFAGSQNAGKFTFLPGGLKFEKMSFNPQESQLLESRQWNEETVARMFGGAPLVVKLGLGNQTATYAASSAFMDDYFNTSLLPYTTSIEQTISRDLIDVKDRSTLYARHNADIILRGSPQERAETNQILIQSFQMTPNEARENEDRDPLEGGDFLSGGTGTPVIFDTVNQRFFIPGQLSPTLSPEEAQQKKDLMPPAPMFGGPNGTPAAAGSDDDDDETEPNPNVAPKKKKKPGKANARLEAIANSLAERVERKAAKSKLDAKFVAEVMACSHNDAETYCKTYETLTPEERLASLLKLAMGEQNEE